MWEKVLGSLVASVAVILVGCGGGGGGDKDVAADKVSDVPRVDAPGDVVPGDVAAPEEKSDVAVTEMPVDQGTDPGTDDETHPPEKCLGEKEASKELALPGLDGPVEVVVDKWGIPHVYASTDHDLWMAEGFVVAQNRFVQMHAMRSIAAGKWSSSPAAGKVDLSNDVYMRILGLRHVADEIWTDIQANNAELKMMLEAFTAGVNAYIDGVSKGTVPGPIEWAFLGKVGPWEPADCLTIGRLQSWDLSFDGNLDEIAAMERIEFLKAKFGATPLAGIAADIMRMEPATAALTVPAEFRKGLKPFDLARAAAHPFYSRFRPGYFKGILEGLRSVGLYREPGSAHDTGSNNWVISGALTESGATMLANDTHLSLRNPPVFMQVHLNTTRAGGDLDLMGVTFPGIPSIILGRNAHAAWGGTVYYADVTDVYVENVVPGDPTAVEFDGGQVQMTVRSETFDYAVPKDGCGDWIDDFVKGTDYSVEEKAGRCVLTIGVLEVPHHGPVIPGSMSTDNEGKGIALTWKWTGFDPSGELEMVRQFGTMATPEEFRKALENFGVGGQNWIYADDQGHIAYAAFVRLPIRAHLATPPVDFPPFLPMPGQGDCEWTGDVPLAEMPQAEDPQQGWIASANGDALGYSQDGDPFNDQTYQGYLFDIGFRTQRIHDLLGEQASAAVPFSVADIQAVQADHVSPLGKTLVPLLLAAVTKAETMDVDDPDYDPDLAALLDADLLAARDALAAWSFAASSGMADGATEADKADAVATAIFNTWLVFLSQHVVADKFDDGDDETKDLGLDFQIHGRFLVNLLAHPETLASYDETLKDSLLWDDTTTDTKVETRTYAMVKALSESIAFLADPEEVGPKEKGGFGTNDMSQWLWGKLHTITLKHSLGGEANIPPESQYPAGYPRPGDNFTVDAANPGFTDTSFTFGSGAAIRNVFVLEAGKIQSHMVIPGGEDGAAFAPHYSDLFYLWAKNQTVDVPSTEEEVLAELESCSVLKP